MTAEHDTTASPKEAPTEANRTATGADILAHMRRIDAPMTSVAEAAADLDADPAEVRATLRDLERDGTMESAVKGSVRMWWFSSHNGGDDLERVREHRRSLREIQ